MRAVYSVLEGTGACKNFRTMFQLHCMTGKGSFRKEEAQPSIQIGLSTRERPRQSTLTRYTHFHFYLFFGPHLKAGGSLVSLIWD